MKHGCIPELRFEQFNQLLHLHFTMAASSDHQPPALSLTPQLLGDRPSNGTTEQHENEFYRQSFSNYVITEAPVFTKRPMRMIVVGAGAAGLQIAYKAERQLENVSINVYEKNSDIGGTWLENRYPGCTCDIPSHSYQWTFARNPEWSSYYSSAEEIWRYLKKWAVETGVEKHVSLNHTVKQAKWIEERSVWEVTIIRPDGTVFVDTAEILASCHGLLKCVPPMQCWIHVAD